MKQSMVSHVSHRLIYLRRIQQAHKHSSKKKVHEVEAANPLMAAPLSISGHGLGSKMEFSKT
jgi:hypothetical protein